MLSHACKIIFEVVWVALLLAKLVNGLNPSVSLCCCLVEAFVLL